MRHVVFESSSALTYQQGCRLGGRVSVRVGAAPASGRRRWPVHWGQRVCQHFPDGQLYVNLRGYRPDAAPVYPAEALRGFLDALGVPPGRIPVDLAARSALYRSLLADRRMLVVLDNADTADQVRPPLPGSRTCQVVVTSRKVLSGLVAAEGARPVVLDLLDSAEAQQMLALRLGQERLAAEPEAVGPCSPPSRPCASTRRSGTGGARRTPGTCWDTRTTGSATIPRASWDTSGPRISTGTSATDEARPTRLPGSATPTMPRTTARPRATPGGAPS